MGPRREEVIRTAVTMDSFVLHDVYHAVMTQLLDRAFERVRTLPPETQDAYARVLLRLAGDDDEGDVYQLTPEEQASLATSLDQAAHGEFASDEEVRAVWAKHGQ